MLKSVVSRSAAPDFIENHQTARRGIIQNVSRFVHLDGEGRLAGRQIVLGADAGEDAINQTDFGFARGHETADLRHQGD